MSFGSWYALLFTIFLAIAASLSYQLPDAMQNVQVALFGATGASSLAALVAALLHSRLEGQHRDRVLRNEDLERRATLAKELAELERRAGGSPAQ